MSKKTVNLSPIQFVGSLALAGLAGIGIGSLYNKYVNSKNIKYSIGNPLKRYEVAKETNNDRFLNIDNYFKPEKLKGKRVLVIGGSRGLGLAIVKELVTCDAETIATVRKPTKELQSINGLNSIIENIDVTILDTINNNLIKGLKNNPIDILIVNAGLRQLAIIFFLKTEKIKNFRIFLRTS